MKEKNIEKNFKNFISLNNTYKMKKLCLDIFRGGAQ